MSDKFRRAERLLYQFPINLLRLHACTFELQTLRTQTDCHAQAYEQNHSSTGTHSDPVAAYNAKVEALEKRIQALKRQTLPVLTVRNMISHSAEERDREMYFMMELYYFEHMSINDIAFHLQKSAKTLMRRRHELVNVIQFQSAHYR